MNETLKAVKAFDWGQSRAPLVQLGQEIRDVAGRPEHLAKIEDDLLEIMKSDASPAAKRFVCQRLGLIGTDKSVPVLAAMLADEQTSDIARYALERIPGKATGDALRGALPAAKGKSKIGIVNSMGVRRDADSVAVLGGLLNDNDPAVAVAAAWALGRIGTAQANAALAAAQVGNGPADAPRLAAIRDAQLACAEQLPIGGRKLPAAVIQ